MIERSTPTCSGIVVIGRNEGERLVRCLESVRGRGRVVYVDSGSTDRSVERARGLGAEVVELDMTRPFTAARARNAGFARLRELEPGAEFVQFVDGDCEVREGWLAAGASALGADAGVAAVCGRLREREPERSIWNRLCDMEWDGPVGEIAACGGVAMYRVGAFGACGGFDADIQAGEEPELCFRLREAGGRILRIDAEMALHDAAMTSVSQWTARAKRAGQAYAQCHHKHRYAAFRRRQVLRALAWGGFWPLAFVAALAGMWWSWWSAVLAGGLLILLVVTIARISVRRMQVGTSMADAVLYSSAIMMAKPMEAMGVARFYWSHLISRPPELIEYRRTTHAR